MWQNESNCSNEGAFDPLIIFAYCSKHMELKNLLVLHLFQANHKHYHYTQKRSKNLVSLHIDNLLLYASIIFGDAADIESSSSIFVATL